MDTFDNTRYAKLVPPLSDEFIDELINNGNYESYNLLMYITSNTDTYKKAGYIFDNISKYKTNDFTDFLKTVLCLVEDNKYDKKCLLLQREALKNNPKNSLILNYLGARHIRGDSVKIDYKMAEKYFLKAIEHNPIYQQPYVNLGVIYTQYLNKLDVGINYLMKVGARGAANLGAIYNGGLYIERDSKRALEYYTEYYNINVNIQNNRLNKISEILFDDPNIFIEYYKNNKNVFDSLNERNVVIAIDKNDIDTLKNILKIDPLIFVKFYNLINELTNKKNEIKKIESCVIEI
jgi:hypothetical protein